MDINEHLKIYQAYAEISRKWVTALDAKAAFASAANGAVLAYAWGAAKLQDAPGLAHSFALLGSVLCLASLVMAVMTVLPRVTLKAVFTNSVAHWGNHQPVSFYSYVADSYPDDAFHQFKADVEKMDDAALAREALEQHFTICHVAQQKTRWVIRAKFLLILAMACVATAVAIKEYA